MEFPKQIQSNSEKAAFLMGYLWSALCDAGLIHPKNVYLFGNKEEIVTEDFISLFRKMKSVVEKRQAHQYEQLVRDIEENLKSDDEFTIRHQTFYAIGQNYYTLFKGESMVPAESAEKWGIQRNTVIAALNRGRFDDQIARGLVRRSGNTWLITEQAMREVFGEPKSNKEE